MAKAAALPATAQAAGVKTPGAGAFSDAAQVGAMIQSMYPQYRSMDATVLGQRWIDVHTPQATGGGGGSVGTAGTTATSDTLLPPTASGGDTLSTNTLGTNTQFNTPDLSGLSKFATPVKSSKQVNVKISQPVGMNQLTQGNQLASQPQTNSPWLGSQIWNGLTSFFKAPNLQATSKPPGY